MTSEDMSEATYTSLDIFLASLAQIPAEQRRHPSDYLAQAKKASRILLIEDEEMVSDILQMRLGQWGYTQIRAVNNGKSAMEAIAQRSVDLILSDGEYPPNNCYPLIKAAIATYKYSPLRIIVMSGKAPEVQERLISVLQGIPDIAENEIRRLNDKYSRYHSIVPVLQKPPFNGVLDDELRFVLNQEIQKALLPA